MVESPDPNDADLPEEWNSEEPARPVDGIEPLENWSEAEPARPVDSPETFSTERAYPVNSPEPISMGTQKSAGSKRGLIIGGAAVAVLAIAGIGVQQSGLLSGSPKPVVNNSGKKQTRTPENTQGKPAGETSIASTDTGDLTGMPPTSNSRDTDQSGNDTQKSDSENPTSVASTNAGENSTGKPDNTGATTGKTTSQDVPDTPPDGSTGTSKPSSPAAPSPQVIVRDKFAAFKDKSDTERVEGVRNIVKELEESSDLPEPATLRESLRAIEELIKSTTDGASKDELEYSRRNLQRMLKLISAVSSPLNTDQVIVSGTGGILGTRTLLLVLVLGQPESTSAEFPTPEVNDESWLTETKSKEDWNLLKSDWSRHCRDQASDAMLAELLVNASDIARKSKKWDVARFYRDRAEELLSTPAKTQIDTRRIAKARESLETIDALIELATLRAAVNDLTKRDSDIAGAARKGIDELLSAATFNDTEKAHHPLANRWKSLQPAQSAADYENRQKAWSTTQDELMPILQRWIDHREGLYPELVSDYAELRRILAVIETVDRESKAVRRAMDDLLIDPANPETADKHRVVRKWQSLEPKNAASANYEKRKESWTNEQGKLTPIVGRWLKKPGAVAYPELEADYSELRRILAIAADTEKEERPDQSGLVAARQSCDELISQVNDQFNNLDPKPVPEETESQKERREKRKAELDKIRTEVAVIQKRLDDNKNEIKGVYAEVEKDRTALQKVKSTLERWELEYFVAETVNERPAGNVSKESIEAKLNELPRKYIQNADLPQAITNEFQKKMLALFEGKSPCDPQFICGLAERTRYLLQERTVQTAENSKQRQALVKAQADLEQLIKHVKADWEAQLSGVDVASKESLKSAQSEWMALFTKSDAVSSERLLSIAGQLRDEIKASQTVPRPIPAEQVDELTRKSSETIRKMLYEWGYTPLAEAPSIDYESFSDPVTAADHFNRGYNAYFLTSKESEREALRQLTTACELAPTNPIYRYYLGLALLRSGDAEAGAVQVRNGAQLEFTNPYYGVAQQLERVQTTNRLWIDRIRQSVRRPPVKGS